ncbi:cytochrome P450 4C1-like [Cydia splendana]|uniref:cytochrome P450 4C1-like n=1 Tax=Cydia splendana TaxID=1100963 RepID=UPI00300DBD03
MLYLVQKRRRRYLELAALVPTFEGRLPIVGHMYKLIGGSERFWENAKQATIAAEKAGGVLAIWAGPNVVFLINDPEDAMTALNTCLEKSYIYKMGSSWVGDGLITADVPTWKRHRKLLNPTFSQHVLDGFLAIFNRQAALLAQDLEAEAGRGPFDPTDYLTERTLESVCRKLQLLLRGRSLPTKPTPAFPTIFSANILPGRPPGIPGIPGIPPGHPHLREEETAVGISLDDRSVIDTKYKKAVETAFDVLAQRLASFWLHPDFIYRFTAMKQKEDIAMATLHNMSRSVLHKRRKERQEARLANTSSRRFIAFLDLLLDLAEDGSFTDDQIQQELDTLIAAGHDTSSRALISTLVLVGTHLDVQKKIYEEILAVLGSSADLCKEDMAKLVYTEAVIKEVLRISPVTPIIARDIDKELKLSKLMMILGMIFYLLWVIKYTLPALRGALRMGALGTSPVCPYGKDENYTLPAGSGCIVSLWGIHRLPIWGPDRMEFKPERWLDPSKLPQNPGCYGAFSLGRRNCIGKNYALMSVKTNLVHLVRKFHITADYSKVKRKYDLLLKYVEGHHIALELRN